MNYEIYVTETARRDLGLAADYIEFTFKNPEAAEELLHEAEEKFATLAALPHRIKTVNDDFLAALGIRTLRVKNYIAFFTISEKQRRVNIVRFLYKKRDWIHILGTSFEEE